MQLDDFHFVTYANIACRHFTALLTAQAAIFFCTRMIQTWSSFSLVDPCSIFFCFSVKPKFFTPTHGKYINVNSNESFEKYSLSQTKKNNIVSLKDPSVLLVLLSASAIFSCLVVCWFVFVNFWGKKDFDNVSLKQAGVTARKTAASWCVVLTSSVAW